MRIIHGAGRSVKGRTDTTDFQISLVEDVTSTGVTSTQTSTVLDANITTVSHSFVYSGAKVLVTDNMAAGVVRSANITNLSPSVAALSGNTVSPATSASEAMASLVVSVDGVGSKAVIVPVKVKTGGSIDTLSSWVTGSLAKHLYDGLVAIANGVTPSSNHVGQSVDSVSDAHPVDNQHWYSGNANEYSYIDYNNHTYTRNTANVLTLAGIDLTALAAHNFTQGRGDCTAISPVHVIGAEHWFPDVGSTIYFVKQDNTVITRTLVGRQRVIDPIGKGTDACIGILSSTLAGSGIPFLKVLPNDWRNYLPSPRYGIPLWSMQRAPGAVRVSIFNGINPSTPYDLNTESTYAGTYSSYQPWFPPVSGSGSPLFFIIDGKAVLASCYHYMGGYRVGGPMIADLIPQINAAMSSLSTANSLPSYSLTPVQLSGNSSGLNFTRY